MKEIQSRLSAVVFFAITAVASGCATAQVSRMAGFSPNGHRIGIIRIDGYETGIAESALAQELLKLGAQVIERAQVEAILAEQRFQMTGAVDPSQAVQIGKLAGVDLVFLGSVSQPAQAGVVSWKDNTWQNFTVVFSGRLVDVKTGQTVLSGTASGNRGYENKAVVEAVGNFLAR